MVTRAIIVMSFAFIAQEAMVMNTIAAETVSKRVADIKVQHRFIAVDGVRIFYREAGSKDAPTLLLRISLVAAQADAPP